MNALTSGNGISFTILDENLNPVTFKLALLAAKGWSTERNEFGYLSDDGKYVSSCYSGGNTGMGADSYSIHEKLPENYRLVTTDLEEIKKIAANEEAASKKAVEDFRNKQTEKAARINQLPEYVEIDDPELSKHFIFKRTSAEYNHAYSRKIQGGDYKLLLKENENRSVWLSNYRTKSGNLRKKDFNTDFPFFSNPRSALKTLFAQYDELKMAVKTA